MTETCDKLRHMETPRNGALPADVIEEILLRLPVRTLMRFKCVCKQWCALIGSPSFVKQHFDHESNQERLLIRHYGPNRGGCTYALYVDDMCSRYEEPDHLQMPDGVLQLLGPSNGVFCVVSKSGRMALLNPAMGQFKPLPAHPLHVPRHLFVPYHVLGFGYDPLSGYYKLVLLQYFPNSDTSLSTYPYHVSVYNSGCDSWRRFEDVDLVRMHCPVRSVCDTCLNGVLYWLMGINDNCTILAFDMSHEKLQEMQVPDCIKYEERDLYLALYGDSIALLSHDNADKIDEYVDIWVKKKEGCWTKSSTIGPLQDILWPLCFWKNSQLLFEAEISCLILYNLSSQKFRTIDAPREKNRFFYYWVFTYKESLVSLKGEGDNCQLWDTSSDFVKDFFG